MKNWTKEDQIIFESDVKDSVIAAAAYFNSKPNYNDIEEVDFNDICDSFFKEF